MYHKCPSCGFKDTGEHWNPSSMLPPVGLPIIILARDEEVLVMRDQWATSKNDSLVFDRADNAETISGRFPWRHA